MDKKRINIVLKILVSFSLLTIIFLKVDKQALIENFKLVDIGYIPVIITFLLLNYIISSVRWKMLLIYRNTDHVTVKYLSYLYFIGSFFNNFMPTSIGGDVYKIYKLGQKINSKTHAFMATFMERFSGVVVLAFISLLGLSGILKIWTIPMILLFIIGIYIGLKLLKLLSSKFKFFEKMYQALIEYKGKNRVIFWAIITSFIVQLLAIFTQYFIFLSLGIELPILKSLLIFPVVTLASFFIPSLNGIGVQDALYVSFFSRIGIVGELALSASIIYHLFRLGVSLIGGVLYALGKDD